MTRRTRSSVPIVIVLASLGGCAEKRSGATHRPRSGFQLIVAQRSARCLGIGDDCLMGFGRTSCMCLIIVVASTQACQEGEEDARVGRGIDELPELRLVERTVLGGHRAEGPEAFGSVESVTLMASQEAIAVADGATQEICLFDLDGHLLGCAGGRGSGPGEFSAIHRMRASQDGRLHVWDILESRVTTFEPDLQLVAANRTDLGPVQSMIPDFVGFLSNGQFAVREGRDVMGMRDVPEGMRQDTVRLYLYSSTGQFLDTLAVVEDGPMWFRNRDSAWGWEDLIFGRDLISLVIDDELWVGSTDEVSFTRYDRDGQVVGQLELGGGLARYPRRMSPTNEIDASRPCESGPASV